jgi:hypothetical protein
MSRRHDDVRQGWRDVGGVFGPSGRPAMMSCSAACVDSGREQGSLGVGAAEPPSSRA